MQTATIQTHKQRAQLYFEQLQDVICGKLESLDGKARFAEDAWQHPEGGGGRTRVIQNGAVFEKGGVNTSAVSGTLTELLAQRLNVEPQQFFATGISLVIHPDSPMIPTVHANFRYLELENSDAWFGGGADLTPSYLFEDDARYFHSVWKQACDQHDKQYYSKFKKWCDEYFFIKHRKEARGIGGIFFDYLKGDFERLFAFVQTCGNSFLDAYVPIVERRKSEQWGEHEQYWQLLRRGRYAEFNLVYDRGTLFGLETKGRVESILMSLPPLARWDYNIQPKQGSREAQLIDLLRQPKEWV
ncbi:MAG: oxygen-dependent coproporphyrinogen oxidase [Ignavibacteriales bacterium]|nr:oxygen-dependent coproporphyrinogen oxidase [Ignavibacteriales bacterium]